MALPRYLERERGRCVKDVGRMWKQEVSPSGVVVWVSVVTYDPGVFRGEVWRVGAKWTRCVPGDHVAPGGGDLVLELGGASSFGSSICHLERKFLKHTWKGFLESNV